MNTPGRTDLTPIRVLLVEDSAPVCRRLRELLSESPQIHVVGEAANAAQAIRRFTELRPGAVVLDVQLAQGTGLDVLRHVKRADPDGVVIILTNHDFPEFRERCAVMGADYFFRKGTEFERVVEVLDRHATGRGTEGGPS